MFTDERVTKINEMNLSPETEVTLTYSERTDCGLNDSEVEQGLEHLSVVREFAEMVITRGMNFTDTSGDSIIEVLVEKKLIEQDTVEEWRASDEDEGEWFGEVITEAINDNFYDQECVESDITRFGVKRGEIELSTTLVTTVGDVLENNPLLSGWKVTVPLHGGTFTL
tara:strand:- start:100 stop:603 length:504 start_codon:yes stop_codon:yes gene_type:complete